MKLNQFFKLFLLLFLTACVSEFDEREIDYKKEFESLLKNFENSSILNFEKESIENKEFYLSFLEKLDPKKTYFYQTDLEVIKNNKSEGIFENLKAIIDLFYIRYEEALQTRKDLLWSHKFNFEIDEYLPQDPAYYFDNYTEMEDFNRKFLKNSIINQLLDEKDKNVVFSDLRQTYKDRISSLNKMRASDKFGILANNFLSLLDPHAQYFSTRDLENWNLRMNLSFEGIGAILSYENEFAKIEELMPGGPAINSNKINVGDRVIGVGQGDNGRIVRVVGWRLDDIVEKIRGEEGTVVKLQIQNETGNEIVRLERGKVVLEESDASSKIFEKNEQRLGYINLPSFYSDAECLNLSNPYTCKSAGNDVREILVNFKSEEVNGVVIDLRNNGGGFLYEADFLTRLFINAGPTVQIKNSNNEIDVFSTWSTRRAWSKPVVVLVNKFSASASEIFAGALQDYKRALIIGQETYGKGSVQRFETTLNGQFKFTDSLYYRISGEPTQIFGVTPDLELPALLNSEDFGEKKYNNALMPSSIESTTYFSFNNEWGSYIAENHSSRISASPLFTLIDEMKRINENNEDISLKLDERFLIEQERQEKNLDLANLRRELAGKPQFKNYEDFLSYEAEDIVIDEAIEQSLEVLLDMIGRG